MSYKGKSIATRGSKKTGERLELVCPNWEKTQEYCGVENMPEDTWLLELG